MPPSYSQCICHHFYFNEEWSNSKTLTLTKTLTQNKTKPNKNKTGNVAGSPCGILQLHPLYKKKILNEWDTQYSFSQDMHLFNFSLYFCASSEFPPCFLSAHFVASESTYWFNLYFFLELGLGSLAQQGPRKTVVCLFFLNSHLNSKLWPACGQECCVCTCPSVKAWKPVQAISSPFTPWIGRGHWKNYHKI